MFKYAVLAYLIFNGIILAQNNSKATANIKVKLINGAAVSIIKDNLDSNQFSNLVLLESRRKGSRGVLLHFTGKNSGDVIINYEYLNNHKINSDDKNSFEFVNGSTFTFKEQNDTDLYLWIDESSNHPISSDKHFPAICSVSLVYN